MFLRFTVGNYRSIKEKQTLSMVAGSGRDELGGVFDSGLKDIQLVPVAAIYGANASGKTNILSALEFMVEAVMLSQREWKPEGIDDYEPFVLDVEYVARPSFFEIDFIFDEIRFTYGFELDAKKIVAEWLHAYPKGRKQVWLNREGPEFYFGSHLTGENRSIQKLTRTNSLFLSAAAQSGHEVLSKIYDFFVEKIVFEDPLYERAHFKASIKMLEQPYFGELIAQIMRTADLGITSARVVRPNETQIQLFDRELEKRGISAKARARRISELEDVVFTHQGDGGNSADISYFDESEGTQTLFTLSSRLLMTQLNGGILCIDEFESSLHPEICKRIIDAFRDPKKNLFNAQLIFTTHNTRLLQKDTLRRDEVWFTEKSEGGATTLYPLTDFHPRKNENRELGYLQGRYGAVPLIDQNDFLATRGDADGETR